MRLMSWLLILLLFTSVSYSQTNEGTTATIEGAVTNSVTSQPVKGADISLFPVRQMNASQAVTTDEKGRFELTGVKAGHYKLLAHARSYVDQG
jgi:uncharacterized surface anchored protein